MLTIIEQFHHWRLPPTTRCLHVVGKQNQTWDARSKPSTEFLRWLPSQKAIDIYHEIKRLEGEIVFLQFLSDINPVVEEPPSLEFIIDEVKISIVEVLGIPLPQAAQMSTIQGITMDEEGNLIFVGNHQDYLTELGKNMGNSGGVLSDFEIAKGVFKNYESLSLPADLNPRGIRPIGENRYFISCNDGVQYILER